MQVKLLKVFPHKYSATLAICVIASVQAAVMGLCLDTKPKSWRLGWNLQLITIFYSVSNPPFPQFYTFLFNKIFELKTGLN